MLITAIHAESLIVAASLSQLQGLLQQDTLRNRPLLHETFDQALTGCRVVYMCLSEEVQELSRKASSDSLKSMDRAKSLWREDSFKELLQQIRDQQSTLSILIQGLQTEPMTELKGLVQTNSARMEQIATRSKALREKHPNIRVPESVFTKGTDEQITIDASKALQSAEFDFDDEVINSTAYRRAIALATMKSEGKVPMVDYDEEEPQQDDEAQIPENVPDIASLELEPNSSEEAHFDLLHSLEQNLLPFMPPALSESGATTSPMPGSPYMPDYETESQEEKPPLPPRRPTQLQEEPKEPKLRSSVVSSHTTLDPSLNRKPTVEDSQQTAYDSIFRALSEPGNVHLASNYDVEIHNIWSSLIVSEQELLANLGNLRTLFYDPVIKQWPVLEKHLTLILLCEQLVAKHQKHLLEPMEKQIAESPSAACNPNIFEGWASDTHQLYRDYCQQLPHANGALLLTQEMDPKFSSFIGTLGLDPKSTGKAWEDYLLLPISQLDIYMEALRRVVKTALLNANPTGQKHESRIMHALDIVRRRKKSCLRVVEQFQAREDTQNLHRRIQTLNSNYLSLLDLLHPGRRIIHQGSLAFKKKGHGSWQKVHAVLLDNYLFWGMVKPPKPQKKQPYPPHKDGNIWVLQAVSLHVFVSRSYYPDDPSPYPFKRWKHASPTKKIAPRKQRY